MKTLAVNVLMNPKQTKIQAKTSATARQSSMASFGVMSPLTVSVWIRSRQQEGRIYFSLTRLATEKLKMKMTLIMTSLVGVTMMMGISLTPTVNAQIYYCMTVNQTRILEVVRRKTTDNSGVSSPQQVSVKTRLLGQNHMAFSFPLMLVERVQSLENRITIGRRIKNNKKTINTRKILMKLSGLFL